MCGIAGIIAEKEHVVRDAVAAMTACQAHRGPDDAGESVNPFAGRFLGLGHRRLSILDLSPAGHQPMVHPVTGDQIIFNGEIYNFAELRRELEAAGARFVGHSDTEVMLHALARWGPECVRRFHGMFAFAFYDRGGRRVILARDSVGIKPLYTARGQGGATLFASEVRALLASGLVSRRLDVRGVAGLLAYGAVQQPYTVFGEIRCFPPGHYQVLHDDGNADAPVRFWDYPAPDPSIDEAAAITAVRRTLDEAVRDHLVADVPVGVFLSSGLDSTIIAALAARHHPHLRSFTVGFADQPDLSEHALARETAKLFGLDHCEIDVRSQDAEEAAVRWLAAMDQPSFDGLNVFVISQAVRARGITVALSGQGGDELFGGYPSFADVPRMRRLVRCVGWMPGPLRDAAAIGAGRSRAVREKLRDVLRTDGSVLALALQRRRAMSDGQLAALGLGAATLGLHPSFEPPEAIEAFAAGGDDVVWAVSQAEARYYQGNMLLRDGDANGMAHSLEIRVPILDQRVLDLACRIPGAVRLPVGRPGKYLLRAAFPEALRPALSNQAKRGFTLPLRRWMTGPMRSLCEGALASLKQVDVLRAAGIDAIWQAFMADPESPVWSRALTLVALGSYVERNGATA